MGSFYGDGVFLLFALLSVRVDVGVFSYSLTSCVDPESPSSITSWRTTIPHKVGVVNGSKVFAFDGPVGNNGADFELKFGERVRSVPNNRVYLYIVYLNESPRRIVLQPVKNEKGSDFTLLPGVTAAPDTPQEWGEAVEEIDAGDGREPSITGILKKPQRISVRKLVLFSLRSTSGESVAGVVTELRSKSCSVLISAIPAPPQPSASHQHQPTTRPKTPPTTTTTSCPNNPSVARTPPSDSCSVCPECKCVCNCNCKDAC